MKNGELIPYALGILHDPRELDASPGSGPEPIIFYGEDCIDEFLDYILKYDKDSHIFVHNLARFDSKFLIKKIVLRDINLEIIPSKNKDFSITGFTIKSRTPLGSAI